MTALEVRDVEVALTRPGHEPDAWTALRFGDTDDVVADERPGRPVETWLRFALPAGTRGFALTLRHMPTHVWIDDVEVTVAYDAGRISLVHDVPVQAVLTLQCLRSLEHRGLAALATPLRVDVSA